MGVYIRKDSPWFWMFIEGIKKHQSTGIPHHAGSPAQEKELRRQAEAIYADAKAKAARQQFGLELTAKPTIAWTAHAAWYETHEIAHHRAATKERSMLAALTNYFERFTSIAEITAEVVKEWMTWRKRSVKAATVNRELDLLKRVLAVAAPKYLAASPIAGLRRFRVEEVEPRVLTPLEESRLLAVADADDHAWLLMALDTLLRLSNVVHLKWAQVKTAQRIIVPLNAKVKHDSVPISARLQLALARLSKENEWVFPAFHRHGTGPTAAKNQIIRRLDLLCQKAGIPHGRAAEGITFHCLRHTGATRALQRGASVRTVMKLGGWKTEHMVMRYVHAADSDVRAAADSIGGSFTPPSRKSKTALKLAQSAI